MLSPKITLTAILVAVLTLCTSCGNQPAHPNQINTFDGASYDSLTVAHAALASLRSPVSTTQRRYITPFNQAAGTYATAYAAYVAYRGAQTNQAGLTLAISDLAASIASLEGFFQTDMRAAPADIARVQSRAAHFRSTVGRHITLSDILTELEIGASIAATIPLTQPYSTMAEIVIKMAQDSLNAFGASSGQLIKLSAILPVASIQ